MYVELSLIVFVLLRRRIGYLKKKTSVQKDILSVTHCLKEMIAKVINELELVSGLVHGRCLKSANSK